MKLLLDTSAYSELKRGHEGVAGLVRRSERIYFSSVVAGELLFGFWRGNRYARNRAELEDFLERPFVTFLAIDLDAADRFGRVAASLRAKGRPLPTNDVWIAAHAMESGSILVSFDEHFGEVDGLAWIRPGS